MLGTPKKAPDALTPLAEHPEYRTAAAELQTFMERANASEQRIKRAKARLRRQDSKRPVADRAKDLVEGGEIVSGDPNDEIIAARDELAILLPAIGQKTEALLAAKGLASYEACLRFKPQVDDALRRALQALRDLHAAYAVIYGVFNELRGKGYDVAHHALPTFQPQATYALGDPDQPDTGQASVFREWLIRQRIIDERIR